MNKNIVLIGFMGSGKSTIAAELSRISGLPVTDTDALIVQQEQQEIPAIFERFGEPHFRQIESEVFKKALGHPTSRIIATGGGLPMQKSNQDLLKSSFVVYLYASFEQIQKRIGTDPNRPLFQSPADSAKLWKIRQPIYESLADFILKTGQQRPAESAKIIWERFKKGPQHDSE